jgi:hypothetical protein
VNETACKVHLDASTLAAAAADLYWRRLLLVSFIQFLLFISLLSRFPAMFHFIILAMLCTSVPVVARCKAWFRTAHLMGFWFESHGGK